MSSFNVDGQRSSTEVSPKTLPYALPGEDENKLNEFSKMTLYQQIIEERKEILEDTSKISRRSYDWSDGLQSLLPSDKFSSGTFSLSENSLSLFDNINASEYKQIVSQDQIICQDSSDRQTRNLTVLSRLWHPCSAGFTIGEQLDFIQFPVSYRELVYRWIALNRPQLEYFNVSLISQISTIQHASKEESDEAISDLQCLCEAQEYSIIDSIGSYMENGHIAQKMTFTYFASYVDVYSTIHAELTCLENGLPKSTQNISRLYEEAWWNALQAFDLDRSICTARSSHDCFRYLLWGEVYNWPLQVIIDKYQIFKNRSSSIKPILISQFKQDISVLLESPSGLPSTSHISNDFYSPKGDKEKIALSPMLPTNLSAIDLTDADKSFKANDFNTSPSLNCFTSYWQREQCDISAYESPSTQSASTIGRSPLQSDSYQDFLATGDEKTEIETIFQIPYNFAFTATPNNVTLSMPTTPLMSTQNSYHDFKNHSSPSSFHEGQQNFTDSQQQDISSSFSKVKARESSKITPFPLLNILNQQRRESTSSIGSSFKSENALEKVEEYRNLLQDAVTQLDTAARLLSLQTLQDQSPPHSRKHLRQMAAAARAISTMSKTAKRARLISVVKPQRPYRPRSYTSS